VTGKVEAGRFEAQAVLKRAIVPLETGVHRVPVPAFASFDPKTERYSVETFDNLLLNVLPGEATAAALSQYGAAGAGPRQEVASLGEDILPIHTAHRLQPVPLTPLGCLESLLVGVPGLSWLGLAFAGRFSRSGRRRRQVATLRARLSRLPADPRERISEIEALYREILGLSLGLPAASVDEDRLREGLRDAPVEEALELYRRIARARYGGQPDPDLHAEVVRYLGKLLGRLS
jgi:hypothetical protein